MVSENTTPSDDNSAKKSLILDFRDIAPEKQALLESEALRHHCSVEQLIAGYVVEGSDSVLLASRPDPR